jgi:peroxiredoxin
MSDETDEVSPTGLRNRLLGVWSRLRERWWSRWAIDLALFGGLLFAITWYQGRTLVDTGEKIPSTTLQSTDGEPRSLADPNAERTLVYLWAPWCGVCSAETGTLNRAQPWFGDNVAVRSVVFDYRDPEHARRSAEQKGTQFPVLLGTNALRERLSIDAFPTFYVLSDEGRVLRSTKGYTTTLGLLARVWL